MTGVTVMPRQQHEWTVADLQSLPDDGLQYELLDGVLLVSPAPVPRHQRAAFRIAMLLNASCPPELEVLPAPLDWQPDERTSLQPDVLVVRKDQIGDKNITAPLSLAVEVLSPSTRRKDAVLKRSKYEDAGVASYWLVDPEEPSIRAFDLVDGHYAPAGEAIARASIEIAKPFRVTVTPALLVDPL